MLEGRKRGDALSESVADVVDALKQRGFEYQGRINGDVLTFSGALLVEQSAHPCDVFIDPEFVELPIVRLHKIPDSLPPVVEHIAHDGTLCYLTEGTFVVDVFDPVGQTLAFVERAQYVLGQILKRELIADLEEEFLAYWQGHPCLLDVQQGHNGSHSCVLIGQPEVVAIAITEDVPRTQKKLKTMGLESNGQTMPACRLSTTARPRPSKSAWPPKTLGELLQWQQTLDPTCRKRILKRVERDNRAKRVAVVFVIQSPLVAYGFIVWLNKGTSSKKASPTREYLWTCPVENLDVFRIDASYVAQRNTPGRRTLAGKDLALIGCGTIGGFLADLLVKSGAGTGGGTLTLVDDDSLYPQNLGRHRLGFSRLLKNKAEALAAELALLAPDANLRPLPIDVREAHLGKIDLLIDATGEESITHWMSGKYSRQVPLLAVWVEGPGTAVRTLLRHSKEGACPRCLFRHNREGRFLSVEGGPPQIFAGQGCEGAYVPFSATVSVQAAALCADVVVDWVNEVFEPALRTRLTDVGYALATEDCTPASLKDCPACGT